MFYQNIFPHFIIEMDTFYDNGTQIALDVFLLQNRLLSMFNQHLVCSFYFLRVKTFIFIFHFFYIKK